VLTAIWPRPASAEDWRYCVARDEANGRFYLSEAFPSDKPIDSVEQAFNAFLDKTGVNHRWGICPRADNAFDAAADVARAAQYNKLMGLEQRIITWPDQPL
jgi:hypothetical protein